MSPPKPSGFGARSNGAGVGNLKKKGLVAVHLNQPGSTRSVAQGAPGIQGTPVPGCVQTPYQGALLGEVCVWVWCVCVCIFS